MSEEENRSSAPENADQGSADATDAKMDVVEKADIQQLQHFVTTIKTAEQQVGENIIQALQQQGTVAVLTTVVMGNDGQQCVVSAALKPEMMQQVQMILAQAQQERIDEEPCVGFHCLVKPKQGTNSDESPPQN